MHTSHNLPPLYPRILKTAHNKELKMNTGDTWEAYHEDRAAWKEEIEAEVAIKEGEGEETQPKEDQTSELNRSLLLSASANAIPGKANWHSRSSS